MPPTDQSRNHVGELNERKNCEKFQNHFEKPPGSKIRCCKTRPSPETANLARLIRERAPERLASVV
ncbi:hypothetical protein ACVMGC_007955 [Bradyrhizobium barranii subsp. barranii]